MSEPEYLRIEEVATILGLSRSTCYSMAASGELPAIRLGRRSLRVPRHRLVEWAERQAPAWAAMHADEPLAGDGRPDIPTLRRWAEQAEFCVEASGDELRDVLVMLAEGLGSALEAALASSEAPR